MKYPSKLIEDAVDAFSQLPSIGKKTALRLVLHLIDQEQGFTENITSSLNNLRSNIKHCTECHNLSDHNICNICSDKSRNNETICLVESVKDVMAIENTGQYSGKYHVLGGVISPLEGVGIHDLNIESLFLRIKEKDIKEVIMAISPTIDGDTTMYYIGKKLKDANIKVSTIARGISFGGELEYADGMTLGRSIVSRLPYDINTEV